MPKSCNRLEKHRLNWPIKRPRLYKWHRRHKQQPNRHRLPNWRKRLNPLKRFKRRRPRRLRHRQQSVIMDTLLTPLLMGNVSGRRRRRESFGPP